MNQSNLGLNQRSLLLSTLIAGVVMGLFSHIPVVACLNCLLFGWVWGGAIFAVYLYRNYQRQAPVTVTQGLVIGALAGVIGAIVGGLAAAIFGGLTAAFTNALSNIAGQTGQSIPNFFFTTGFSIVRTIIDIILYAVIGAIGGLIATGLIWKAPAVPQPPYYPPPPSGPAV